MTCVVEVPLSGTRSRRPTAQRIQLAALDCPAATELSDRETIWRRIRDDGVVPQGAENRQRPSALVNALWGAGIQMPTYDEVERARIRRGWCFIALLLLLSLSVGLVTGLAQHSWYWGVSSALLTYAAVASIGAVALRRMDARSRDHQ
jgi:hypothetical protein